MVSCGTSERSSCANRANDHTPSQPLPASRKSPRTTQIRVPRGIVGELRDGTTHGRARRLTELLEGRYRLGSWSCLSRLTSMPLGTPDLCRSKFASLLPRRVTRVIPSSRYHIDVASAVSFHTSLVNGPGRNSPVIA